MQARCRLDAATREGCMEGCRTGMSSYEKFMTCHAANGTVHEDSLVAWHLAWITCCATMNASHPRDASRANSWIIFLDDSPRFCNGLLLHIKDTRIGRRAGLDRLCIPYHIME